MRKRRLRRRGGLDRLLSNAFVDDPNGSVVITPLFASTDESPVDPFAHVTITDPNGPSATDTAKIYLGSTRAAPPTPTARSPALG